MNEYLEKLRAAMLAGSNAKADALVSTKKEDYEKPLVVAPPLTISGDVYQDLYFDSEGNAYFTFSKSTLGITINLSASINGLDAIFDIWVDTNYSEHFEWHDVRQGQQVSCRMRTNTWSSTTIKARIHSSKPNSKATAHLHYST